MLLSALPLNALDSNSLDPRYIKQKCVLIVRSVSDRRAYKVNVWGNLISIHLEPNEPEPNAFEGRADSSICLLWGVQIFSQ